MKLNKWQLNSSNKIRYFVKLFTKLDVKLCTIPFAFSMKFITFYLEIDIKIYI